MDYLYMRHETLLDTNEESILIAGIDDSGQGVFLSLVVDTLTPKAWVEDEANRTVIEDGLNGIGEGHLEVSNQAKWWVKAHQFKDLIDGELEWIDGPNGNDGEIDFLVNQIPLILDPISKRLGQDLLRIIRQNRRMMQYIKRDMTIHLKDDRV